MTEALVPFAPVQESGMEPLGGAGVSSLNVVVTGKGVVERRPGICAAEGISSDAVSSGPIEAVFQSMTGPTFAVGTSAHYGLSHMLGRLVGEGEYVGYLLSSQLTGTSRPVFCDLGPGQYVNRMLVASGGTLQWLRTGTPDPMGGWTLERLGVGTTVDMETIPVATHVTSMNQRLVANETRYDSNLVRYSGLPSESVGWFTWTAGIGTAGAFSAESSPDPVVAMGRDLEYLFVFGSQTTQLFAADPTWVFAPVATLSVGCAAPYSIIDCEYWIDQRKRVVRQRGGQVVSLSGPIQAVLDTMTVQDAYGYKVEIGGMTCLVWTFPSDGRTFVFQEGVGWGQWQSGVPVIRQFDVTAHCRAITTGTNLVGTALGRVGKLSLGAATDFGDSIQARVETGYLNRETLRRKHCLGLTVVLQRGLSGSPGTAVIGFRDRPGPWRARIPISLGATGDTVHTLRFRSLGVYERRQWFFEFTGSERLALVSATEEYEVI
jgi:hypothetical protein